MPELYDIYLRKSRADRDAEANGGGDTLLRHRTALLELARKMNLTIYHIFEEVVSGETIANRPEMQKLLAEVETGQIAGVLVMEPEALILDEPTAGLDPQGVSDLLELLTSLRDSQGMTILMATHDMDVVPLCCDYAYLLGGGRVLLEGTPDELFANPEALRANHLRLPRIAHLMEVLRRADGLDTHGAPATIGAARREILRLLKEEETV